MPNLVKANLLSRKTRSFISIFGIALSVSLLLVLVGLVNGNIRDLANRIASVGADIMVSKDSFGAFYPNEMINEKWAAKIRDEFNTDYEEEFGQEGVRGVDKVTSVVIESVSHIQGKRQFLYGYGIDYEEYSTLGAGFDFVDGGPLEDEFDLILERRMAEANGLKVGDKVEMLGQEWRLCGILKEAVGARIFVRRDTLTRVAKPGREGKVTFIFVQALNREDTSVLVDMLKEYMGEGYAVRNINELFSLFIGNTLGLRELMIALIGICAIICFSVILLSMYNSIIERTREIGILKSLGATRGFIVKEIVKEALFVTIIGVVVGYLITLGAMFLVKGLFPLLEMEMTLDWMGYGAAIALLASMLGTLYPASRAIRLDPVIALNYE